MKRLPLFLLVIAPLLLGASCRVKPPRQTLCILDPESGGAWCYDTDAIDIGEPPLLPIADMGNYVCRSPDDELALEAWIKRLLIKCSSGSTARFIKDSPIPLEKIFTRPAGQ